MVKFFVPPESRGHSLLGKTAPDFKFVDLDGKPVTPESLAGKVAVLDFWATWCGPCRESLPKLEKVREQFKDNPKVAFYAVSVDEPKVENKELAKTFEDLKVRPADPSRHRASRPPRFKFRGIPTMFIIDDKGVVQDCEAGVNPETRRRVCRQKIEKLLAGENIYEKSLKEYQDQIDNCGSMRRRARRRADERKPTPASRQEETIALPEAKMAPRSEPATFKLTPLWKCAEVKSPGNILVVGGKNGPARLLVVEDWNSVAEVGLDGKLIAPHKLNLAEERVRRQPPRRRRRRRQSLRGRLPHRPAALPRAR